MVDVNGLFSSDEEAVDGLDLLAQFAEFDGPYKESEDEDDRPMQRMRPQRTKSFEETTYTHLADDYKIDPGKFIRIMEGGKLRNVYKLGQIIEETDAGRINHGRGLQFGIDRSIKSIKRAQKNSIPEEVELLKTIDHPCANKVIEIFEDNRSFHLVRSPVKGRKLAHVLGDITKFSERESSFILVQILSLANYLHQRNIVLRAIRPDNIRVRNRVLGNMNYHQVHVVDFNEIVKIEQGVTKHIEDWIWEPQNCQFVPPEVHLSGEQDQKFDEWSCGVLAHILFTGGSFPFSGETPEEQIEQMKTTDFQWDSRFNTVISQDAQDLISKLLSRDPKKRITAEWAILHRQFEILRIDKSRLISEKVVNVLMTRTETKFYQIVLYFFALKWLNEEDVIEEYETFFALDIDNDGFISLDDLRKSFRNRYKTKAIIEALVDRHMQHKLYITFLDFLTFTMDKELLLANMEMLEEVFKFFDHDGSGEITGDELRKQFQDKQVADEVWEQMLLKTFGKPAVNFEDFVQMIRDAQLNPFI